MERTLLMEQQKTETLYPGNFVELTKISDYGEKGTKGIVVHVSTPTIRIQFKDKGEVSELPYPTHLVRRISKLN